MPPAAPRRATRRRGRHRSWECWRRRCVVVLPRRGLAAVRGGNYSAGTPREGWDHSTAYLRRILADVWGAELTVVERDFTLVGVNPALDAFTEQAKVLHAEALSAAREAGRALGAVPVG
ncbi:hypothetical protein SAMN06264364_1217 [Quadrisphaera granulorum]|uniref:FMN-dependent NADH-azoreductase n=1 Tax=Quadrisphaera granulorum TaxID=317664 RepID=A0A316A2C7_9ACTN|nr:hypothetical protein [Quadrisphaera granulorum]PWJ51130.1 hypothetical protein BXY45_1217 [Quadrisphaera granulorum]SZE97780.1 hypothetical protein SAMN06264364_1217 [Quadrisphaera granulorum]